MTCYRHSRPSFQHWNPLVKSTIAKRVMFEGYHILLITDGDDSKELDKLTINIENHGGKVWTKKIDDNSENFLDKYPINFVITSTIEFIEYNQCLASLIPVTIPQWAYDSLDEKKVVNVKRYNPDSRFFMRDCYICCGDDITIADKEIIYGGVKGFGGMYLDELTRLTTHLITTNDENDKAIIALSSDVDIILVNPKWIQDCFKLGKRLNEANYLLNTSSASSDSHPLLLNQESSDLELKYALCLEHKRIYIANDYILSEELADSVKSLIQKNGGIVEQKFSNQVDIYIGKYRHGVEFGKSLESNRIIIGNLPWLYFIMATNYWTLPTNSLVLHYPIPMTALSSFKDVKICISNYSGDARHYLSRLITLLGGTFTKTLTRDNEFLVISLSRGKKYKTAKFQWLNNGEPVINIVNHLWLEECYANWEKLEWNNPKYTILDNMEKLIGTTKLNKEILNYWIDVDDSINEELIGDTDYSDDENEFNSKEEAEKDTASKGVNLPKELEEVEKSIDNEATTPILSSVILNEDSITSQSDQGPDLSSKQYEEPPPSITTRPGRSAKSKAALKLQNDMSDLNQYQQISKSSRKMKNFMEQLEKENNSPHSKKHKSEPKSVVKPLSISSESLSNTQKQEKIVVLMTGCDDLSKDEVNRLKVQNITISNDIKKANALVAPKILRTEKFLSSLSHVKYIVHPLFLLDRSKGLIKDIEEYSLDKIIGQSEVNKELGYNSGNGLEHILNHQNPIFKGYLLNLSRNLNGGFDVISKILKAHGVRDLKLIDNKPMLQHDEMKICIVNVKKDGKLIRDNQGDDVIFVEWDWCVRSIFKMEIQELNQYLVK